MHGIEPTLDDFESLQALGRRPPNPRYQREWAEGVSVFDDMPHAFERARQIGFRQGSYLARLVVPEDGSIEFRQTFDDKHHFTIYAVPEVVLALVVGVAVPIPRTEDEWS